MTSAGVVEKSDHHGMTTREFLPIPPIETATDPIASPADLGQRWRALMGPLGFGERLLRFAFVGADRRMLKVLSDVPITRKPQPGLIRDLMMALRDVLEDGDGLSSVALLLTRPGYGDVSIDDRQWATLLTESAAECGVPIEPVFRANDERLVLIEPDQVR